MAMKNSTTAILSCPRGAGNWYICDTGSKFAGCCSRDPCEDGCKEENLVAGSFNSLDYGTFPDLECADGLFYTCTGTNPSFLGCCTENACHSSSGCPVESLRPAKLPPNQTIVEVYLNLRTAAASTILENSTKKDTPAAATAPASVLVSSSNPVSIIALVGIAVLGVAILASTALLIPIYLQRARQMCIERSQRSSEKPPFISRNNSGWTLLRTDSEKMLLQHDETVGYGVQRNGSAGREHTEEHLSHTPLHLRPPLTVLVTSLLNLLLSGFLAFLWFASEKRSVWYTIMTEGWITRVVSITTLLIRWMADIQAAVAAAMLASIMLESRAGINLSEVASLSSMRVSTTPWALTRCLVPGWRQWKAKLPNHSGLLGLLSLLLFTTTALQFSSTVLLSDLRMSSLHGFSRLNHIPVDFAYHCPMVMVSLSTPWTNCKAVWFNQIPRGTTWTTNPPSYPAFAEYSEPATNTQPDVDDTGVLLRAFIPLADAHSRETLRNQTGKALVLDSRVSCQAPSLSNLSWDRGFYSSFTGAASSSTAAEMLQKISNITFSCAFGGPGQISLCQLGGLYPNYAGSLLSQFSNGTVDDLAPSRYGTAFLVIEPSGDWEDLKHNRRDNATHIAITPRGSWSDVSSPGLNSTLSLSLCFAPWDAALLHVNMHSATNRSEPKLRWAAPARTNEVGSFDMSEVLLQHGLLSSTTANRTTAHSLTHSSRGVLTLDRPASFAPAAPDDVLPFQQRPFVQTDISGAGGGPDGASVPLTGNWTAFLTGHTLGTLLANFTATPANVVAADPAVAGLFASALRRRRRRTSSSSHNNNNDNSDAAANPGSGGRSAARALAAVITVLSATAHYGQQPAFDRAAALEQTFFHTVLVPRGARGLAAVAGTLAAHGALCCVAALLFAARTRLSLLGNAWACAGQMLGAGGGAAAAGGSGGVGRGGDAGGGASGGIVGEVLLDAASAAAAAAASSSEREEKEDDEGGLGKGQRWGEADVSVMTDGEVRRVLEAKGKGTARARLVTVVAPRDDGEAGGGAREGEKGGGARVVVLA